MCFTPAISLSTAIIEFSLATIILLYFKKSWINSFFAIFIYVLGFYQFTEFMLCTSTNSFLWAKLGFITYTFLPALGLFFGLKINNKKRSYYSLFLIPLIFSLSALFSKNFIVYATCNRFFVSVRNVLFTNNWYYIYWAYYFEFMLLFTLLVSWRIKKEKDKKLKKIEWIILVTILVSLLGALILMVIFPTLKIMFPSVYCEFALLFSIMGLIVAWINEG